MPTRWFLPQRHHPRTPSSTSAGARSRRRDRGARTWVLLVDSTGLYVEPVTLRDRIEAVLLADRLDRALAEGAAPESGVLLALHAEQLAHVRSRQELAGTIWRLLRAAREPEHGLSRSASMAVLARVRATRPELEALLDRLLAPAPVSARGVALVRMLVRDGSGPLFRYESREDLSLQVRRATDALDPGQDWPV